MLPTIIVGVGIGYVLFFLVVTAGILRNKKSKRSESEPFVSILVACKNEERDLYRCLKSLVDQSYPTEKYEVIVIDDQSSDGTATIISGFERDYDNLSGLNTQYAPDSNLKAKAKAIAFGALQARGDWLFIVDADARMHPDWLYHMLYDVDDTTGMIGGLIMTEEDSYWSVSALEKVTLAYTQPITVGLSGWGSPAICSGPNMAIRRKTYEEYGGLEKVDFNIAEDLALASIVLSADQRIKFHASPETVAYLKSVPTLKHLFSQQRRWIRGGFEQGWQLWAPLAFVFSYHFVFSLILIFGWFIEPYATSIALILKFAVDCIFLLAEKYQMKIPRLMRFSPVMFFYSVIAFIWIPISLLVSSDFRWKGDGYEVKY